MYEVARHHHEKWNGKGYPDGLEGKGDRSIPQGTATVSCFSENRFTGMIEIQEVYKNMIADKIKNARTIKKLTQEQVAEDLNVSRQTISNWENGKSLPDIVSIIRMSELYDLSLDELLKGDATLLNKIERDMKVAKAENNVIKFAWISIVIGVVMIILGNVFDDNPFIDFISAALPWVLLGLMVLFAILYLNKENDK